MRLHWVTLGFALACGSQSEPDMGIMPSSNSAAKDVGPPGAARMRKQKEDSARPEPAPAAPESLTAMSGLMDSEDDYESPADEKKASEKQPKSDEVGQSRTWFPETFLFEPRVVTDAEGRADVTVTVPDRLTTWRILGLAHSRQDGMAGDTTSFIGTLPVYVDPIVPPFLRVGDRIRLPIQIVNTTDELIDETLLVQVEGATLRGWAGRVQVASRGSELREIELTVSQPGPLSLRAGLGSRDTVERSLTVVPVGRPISQQRTGTLAAPRSFTLEGAADLDPASAKVRLLVFQGARSVLQSELSGAGSRSGMAAVGHALLLSGTAPALLRTLGAPIDAANDPDARASQKQLRELALVATQRAMQASRNPNNATASLLVAGALAHPDNPVLSRLGDRLMGQLSRNQRPDGTFGGDGPGIWTVQRVISTTADTVRTMRAAAASPTSDDALAQQRETLFKGVQLRASAAMERFAGQIDDGYTAALVLASGSASTEQIDPLLELVRNGLVETTDGALRLEIEEGVARPDGSSPSSLEGTAVAALALLSNAENGEREDAERLADLGATLLGGYHPSRGWGDGRTDLLALQAVLQLFADPPPSRVEVSLLLDGTVLTSGTLEHNTGQGLLVLDSPTPDVDGPHEWTIQADPPVAGLGYALSLQTWVPWSPPDEAGIELSIDRPEGLTRGKAAQLRVTGVAPSGIPLALSQELPVGVQVDENVLSQLQSQGRIVRYDNAEGRLSMDLSPLDAGQTIDLTLRVIPTLSGELASGPTSLTTMKEPRVQTTLPPTVWKID